MSFSQNICHFLEIYFEGTKYIWGFIGYPPNYIGTYYCINIKTTSLSRTLKSSGQLVELERFYCVHIDPYVFSHGYVLSVMAVCTLCMYSLQCSSAQTAWLSVSSVSSVSSVPHPLIPLSTGSYVFSHSWNILFRGSEILFWGRKILFRGIKIYFERTKYISREWNNVTEFPNMSL